MDLPPPPKPAEVKSVSPSFYNAALTCKAKAAWQQFGARDLIPGPTGGLLGSCFHSVMDAANSGQLPPGTEGTDRAGALFDQKASQLLREAHPLIRTKFASPEKIPYYFQRRGRAVQLATLAINTQATESGGRCRTQAAGGSPAGKPSRLVEKTLSSIDNQIKGRIDLWDGPSAAVIDYKSGQEPKDSRTPLTKDEARQLRLYVYLAIENGFPTSKASIVRGSGQVEELKVTKGDAEKEAEAAKLVRQEFNALVSSGATFLALATPSATGCAGCACIPFCEPFWDAGKEDWEAECGTHIEGEIAGQKDANFNGAVLRTLALASCRGTVPNGEFSVEQIPIEWLSMGSSIPDVGNTVRVVSAARPNGDATSRVIHVDRLRGTAIWKR